MDSNHQPLRPERSASFQLGYPGIGCERRDSNSQDPELESGMSPSCITLARSYSSLARKHSSHRGRSPLIPTGPRFPVPNGAPNTRHDARYVSTALRTAKCGHASLPHRFSLSIVTIRTETYFVCKAVLRFSSSVVLAGSDHPIPKTGH